MMKKKYNCILIVYFVFDLYKILPFNIVLYFLVMYQRLNKEYIAVYDLQNYSNLNAKF